MAEFYVKIPDDKVEFFMQLMLNLEYEYEKLSSNLLEDEVDEETYFTDSDD